MGARDGMQRQGRAVVSRMHAWHHACTCMRHLTTQGCHHQQLLWGAQTPTSQAAGAPSAGHTRTKAPADARAPAHTTHQCRVVDEPGPHKEDVGGGEVGAGARAPVGRGHSAAHGAGLVAGEVGRNHLRERMREGSPRRSSGWVGYSAWTGKAGGRRAGSLKRQHRQGRRLVVGLAVWGASAAGGQGVPPGPAAAAAAATANNTQTCAAGCRSPTQLQPSPPGRAAANTIAPLPRPGTPAMCASAPMPAAASARRSSNSSPPPPNPSAPSCHLQRARQGRDGAARARRRVVVVKGGAADHQCPEAGHRVHCATAVRPACITEAGGRAPGLREKAGQGRGRCSAGPRAGTVRLPLHTRRHNPKRLH